jgi:hypothetical protein
MRRLVGFFSQFEPALRKKKDYIYKHETIIKVYSQEPKLVFAACYKVFFKSEIEPTFPFGLLLSNSQLSSQLLQFIHLMLAFPMSL